MDTEAYLVEFRHLLIPLSGPETLSLRADPSAIDPDKPGGSEVYLAGGSVRSGPSINRPVGGPTPNVASQSEATFVLIAQISYLCWVWGGFQGPDAALLGALIGIHRLLECSGAQQHGMARAGVCVRERER